MMFSQSDASDAPQSIRQFILQHEAELAAVRKEWPDYPVGPTRICAEEALLDDLVAFMNAEDGCEASKDFITQLSVSGGSFLAATIKAKKSLSAVAMALSKYCGMRRCKISVKSKKVELTCEAADVEELERLLKVADTLFLKK